MIPAEEDGLESTTLLDGEAGAEGEAANTEESGRGSVVGGTREEAGEARGTKSPIEDFEEVKASDIRHHHQQVA